MNVEIFTICASVSCTNGFHSLHHLVDAVREDSGKDLIHLTAFAQIRFTPDEAGEVHEFAVRAYDADGCRFDHLGAMAIIPKPEHQDAVLRQAVHFWIPAKPARDLSIRLLTIDERLLAECPLTVAT